nr:hypothetical protein [Rhodococcus sp. 15-1154-1]
MDTRDTVRRTGVEFLKDAAAETLLLTGVAAVGLSLTVSAAGRTGWGAIAGGAAVAALVSAALTFRAGRGRTRDAVKAEEPAQDESMTMGEGNEPGHLDTDSITLALPDSASAVVFPVTTVTRRGVVVTVIVGEYGPSGGTAPEGSGLRSSVLGRWPQARVFERRSTGDSGADPRNYEAFYVELLHDGTRRDVDDQEVFALAR